jgi:hypothetical protein
VRLARSTRRPSLERGGARIAPWGWELAPDRLPPAPLLEPGSRKRRRALVHLGRSTPSSSAPGARSSLRSVGLRARSGSTPAGSLERPGVLGLRDVSHSSARPVSPASPPRFAIRTRVGLRSACGGSSLPSLPSGRLPWVFSTGVGKPRAGLWCISRARTVGAARKRAGD